MTAVDHAELKRLAEGATPGPWTYRDMRPNTYGPAFVDASDVQSLAICGDAVGRSDTHGFCLQVDADVRMANAAFIAAANPAVVLELLSEIEGLKAERPEAKPWQNRKDKWSEAISAAHPVNSDLPWCHECFETAMEMVGNRHGKYELVALVSWLLSDLQSLRTQAPDSWRLIETAPKDGTKFDSQDRTNYGKRVFTKTHWYVHPSVQGWVTDEIDCGDYEFEPTHWRPSALRPQTAESGK